MLSCAGGLGRSALRRDASYSALGFLGLGLLPVLKIPNSSFGGHGPKIRIQKQDLRINGLGGLGLHLGLKIFQSSFGGHGPKIPIRKLAATFGSRRLSAGYAPRRTEATGSAVLKILET